MKTFHRRSKPKKIKYNGKTYLYDDDRTEQFRNNPEDFNGSIILYVLAKNLEHREDFHGDKYQPKVYIFTRRSRTGFIEGSINDEAAMLAAHG